jgi:hypothetical protein
LHSRKFAKPSAGPGGMAFPQNQKWFITRAGRKYLADMEGEAND